MPVGKRDYHLRLQTLLVFLNLKGAAKMKLAFLYCREFVKMCRGRGDTWPHACTQIALMHGDNAVSVNYK